MCFCMLKSSKKSLRTVLSRKHLKWVFIIAKKYSFPQWLHALMRGVVRTSGEIDTAVVMIPGHVL